MRKILLYVLLPALGILFVVLKPAYQLGFNWFYHVVPAIGPNASSATVEAAKAAGGWVPSGTVASKFITFAGVYLLMVVWPFLVQRMTHPAPTKWQKASYSTVFNQLTVQEKIASVRAIQQNNTWRAIGAALFAALVV